MRSYKSFLVEMRRVRTQVTISAIVLTVLVALMFLHLYGMQVGRDVSEARNVGTGIVSNIKSDIDRCCNTALIIKDLYKVEGEDFLDGFESLREQFLKSNVVLGEISWSVGGAQLEDPVLGPKARLAVESGKATIAGPYRMEKGSIGMVIREPIFDDDGNFVAFFNIVVDSGRMEEAIIGQLESDITSKYHFSLWKTEDSTAVLCEGGYIFNSQGPVESRKMTIAFEVPNDTWFIAVEPLSGWHHFRNMWKMFVVLMVFYLAGLVLIGVVISNFRMHLEMSKISRYKSRLREIKRLNEHLEEEREQAQDYLNIISGTGLGVWRMVFQRGYDPRMQPNEKMLHLLGIEGIGLSEEEVFEAWYSRVRPDYLQALRQGFKSILKGEFVEVTYQWHHPSKGIIYVRSGGYATRQENGITMVSGYHADVTEIVEKEKNYQAYLENARSQAEAANAAKTTFLFNMSHDIRTPMNAIIGFRDLLEKYQEDPKRRADYLAKIKYSSDVLLSIINNVLEMARIEKGAVELDETPWNALTYSDTLLSVFHEMMTQKNIELSFESDLQHKYIYIDAGKVRDVYYNLLSNAFKYTPPGGNVWFSLKELPCEREGYVVYQATIRDNGVGMSEEFLPHIFEEFARENNTTENKIEGTGLGMPIVKRLVELMGSTIEVRSKKGEGTTVIITSTHRIAQPDDDNALKDGNQDYDVNFDGVRVLLAEDNALNAEIATDFLEDFGLSVEWAEDGQFALEMVEQHPADYYGVVLMDVQMPRMNGYEATRAIRALKDRDKASVPIIAMTANAFEEDKRDALAAGMNGHVAKPIDIKDLRRLLKKLI